MRLYRVRSAMEPLVIELSLCTMDEGCPGTVRIQRSSALHVCMSVRIQRSSALRFQVLVLQTHAIIHLLCFVVVGSKRSLKKKQ